MSSLAIVDEIVVRLPSKEWKEAQQAWNSIQNWIQLWGSDDLSGCTSCLNKTIFGSFDSAAVAATVTTSTKDLSPGPAAHVSVEDMVEMFDEIENDVKTNELFASSAAFGSNESILSAESKEEFQLKEIVEIKTRAPRGSMITNPAYSAGRSEALVQFAKILSTRITVLHNKEVTLRRKLRASERMLEDSVQKRNGLYKYYAKVKVSAGAAKFFINLATGGAASVAADSAEALELAANVLEGAVSLTEHALLGTKGQTNGFKVASSVVDSFAKVLENDVEDLPDAKKLMTKCGIEMVKQGIEMTDASADLDRQIEELTEKVLKDKFGSAAVAAALIKMTEAKEQLKANGEQMVTLGELLQNLSELPFE